MKTIQFLTSCDIITFQDFNIIDEQFGVLRSYFTGDEDMVQELHDNCDGTSLVIFADGSHSTVPNDAFVMTDWSDENMFGTEFNAEG